ncbi:hypothetical protein LXL04_004353 [Taraxacum kok-saghyz]
MKEGYVKIDMTKHIPPKFFEYIRELIETHQVEIKYVQSSNNAAELFTKALPTAIFRKHVHGIGMRYVNNIFVNFVKKEETETYEERVKKLAKNRTATKTAKSYSLQPKMIVHFLIFKVKFVFPLDEPYDLHSSLLSPASDHPQTAATAGISKQQRIHVTPNEPPAGKETSFQAVFHLLVEGEQKKPIGPFIKRAMSDNREIPPRTYQVNKINRHPTLKEKMGQHISPKSTTDSSKGNKCSHCSHSTPPLGGLRKEVNQSSCSNLARTDTSLAFSKAISLGNKELRGPSINHTSVQNNVSSPLPMHLEQEAIRSTPFFRRSRTEERMAPQAEPVSMGCLVEACGRKFPWIARTTTAQSASGFEQYRQTHLKRRPRFRAKRLLTPKPPKSFLAMTCFQLTHVIFFSSKSAPRKKLFLSDSICDKTATGAL